MNDHASRKRLNGILNHLAAELDVPPYMYIEAKKHYEAVAAWLDAEDSELASCQPVIYPQGSFALGTAVKPLGDEEYDVDTVCLLRLSSDQVTQQQLKELVGDRLKHPQSRYRKMIDPKGGGRRCWTIRYASKSKFHLDVLPAIPDSAAAWLLAPSMPREWADTAICLTDRVTWSNIYAEWPRSNPKGYVAWFKDRMRVSLAEAKQLRAREIRAQVEEIEDFDVRTPLQRLVQILKRHRDGRFNDDEDKPISVIISTLAAQAYNNEGDLAEAVLDVVPRMRAHIEQRDGAWWVPNPVNPKENFADKWAEEPRKATLFFKWLGEIEREYHELLTDQGFAKIGDYLERAFGRRDGNAVMEKHHNRGSLHGSAAVAVPVVVPVVVVPRKSERPTTPTIELPPRPSKPWRP